MFWRALKDAARADGKDELETATTIANMQVAATLTAALITEQAMHDQAAATMAHAAGQPFTPDLRLDSEWVARYQGILSLLGAGPPVHSASSGQ